MQFSSNSTGLISARCAFAAVATLALTSQSAMASPILTDGGFESNPLTTLGNVLGDFTTYQGQWGHEVSTITGVDSGVSPLAGLLQLRMGNSGGGTTQAGQMMDVSAYAVAIDAGWATLTASAWFNANLSNPALCGVYLSYFTGNTYGTIFGPLDASLITLDLTPQTWEQASMTVPVPAGTRWVLMQVAYSDPTIGTGWGFVDNASLEIETVPTPGAAALLGLGGLIVSRRRR
ncbi:MAG: hypothetical protein ACREJO_16550 [Phycisphaerales bacterium]